MGRWWYRNHMRSMAFFFNTLIFHRRSIEGKSQKWPAYAQTWTGKTYEMYNTVRDQIHITKKDRENSQILFYPVTTSQRESKKKTKRKKNCVEHK